MQWCKSPGLRNVAMVNIWIPWTPDTIAEGDTTVINLNWTLAFELSFWIKYLWLIALSSVHVWFDFFQLLLNAPLHRRH